MNLPAEIKIEMHDGVPMVSSLQVAERFGKRHDHVLKAIRNIVETELVDVNLPDFGEINSVYVPDTYTDGRGREQPMFWMTRDGFLALTLPFTGKPAAVQRWKVISALNRAEKILRNPVGPHDVLMLLEMAAKETRQLLSENDKLIDAAAGARDRELLITKARTEDLNENRDLRRENAEMRAAITGVAKHAWKVKAEIEARMPKAAGDLLAPGDAGNVTKLPVRKDDAS